MGRTRKTVKSVRKPRVNHRTDGAGVRPANGEQLPSVPASGVQSGVVSSNGSSVPSAGICQSFVALWNAHGTRMIGVAAAAIGALSLLDKTTIDRLGSMFGPKYEPIVVRGILTIVGVATAYRGWKNSQVIKGLAK